MRALVYATEVISSDDPHDWNTKEVSRWEGMLAGMPILIAGPQLDNGRVRIQIGGQVVLVDRKLVRVLVR